MQNNAELRYDDSIKKHGGAHRMDFWRRKPKFCTIILLRRVMNAKKGFFQNEFTQRVSGAFFHMIYLRSA